MRERKLAFLLAIILYTVANSGLSKIRKSDSGMDSDHHRTGIIIKRRRGTRLEKGRVNSGLDSKYFDQEERDEIVLAGPNCGVKWCGN
ncbi:hypothetical protein JTE90_028326 [Oedothorax gibbosus]|uniref:Uncharacterized protein n=1 Tax=Oedothorax gibbosus TaxID=931172 RepID=A0AAV6V2K4_9ARAC|nr:hypothetical protein JTE90_028326 [Oedothorax gibbosus]